MKPHHHKKREIGNKEALHVVLSSPYQVFFGSRIRSLIESLLLKYAKYFSVKVYHRAYVGNHLHLILLPSSEESLSGFLRVISGQIAMKIKNLKLVPLQKNFWKSRPWSRVIKWGRAYTTAIKYLALNYLEGTKRVIRTHRRDEVRIHARLIEEVIGAKLMTLA